MSVPEGYLQDAAGRLVPLANVKAEHLVEDELVRRLDALAREQSEALSALKAMAFAEVDTLIALLGEKYGAAPGGKGGNVTLSSYDGSLRIQSVIGHNLDFGPELQSAKALIDGCLDRWTQGGNPNIRAIVSDAFDVGQEGKLKVDRILGQRRLSSDDADWLRAMEAISNAVRVTQSKRYVRFYRRDTPASSYKQVALDLASA